MKKYLVFKQRKEEFQEIRETIKVVEKAAASYIQILEKRVNVLQNYKNSLEVALGRMTQLMRETKNHSLFQSRSQGKRILLLVTGNKGLVGKMYHNLVEKALVNRDYYQEIWTLGEKGKEYLHEEGIESRLLSYPGEEVPETAGLEAMGEELVRSFRQKKWKSIDILYPYYISLEDQQPTLVRFLPFTFSKVALDLKNNGLTSLPQAEGWPIFEPDALTILDILIKQYIKIFFIQVIFEAKLSEFSARTVTAQDIVSRTDDMIKKIHLDFLKERKKSLTQKQLESFNVHKTICARTTQS